MLPLKPVAVNPERLKHGQPRPASASVEEAPFSAGFSQTTSEVMFVFLVVGRPGHVAQ